MMMVMYYFRATWSQKPCTELLQEVQAILMLA